MGMGGALAAFFGAPLGGSLFALEVCSRFGVEYFEHLIEAIFCGEICLVIFRSLSGLPIEPIWDLTAISPRMESTTPWHVLLGAVIGLYGAFWSTVFALFHWQVMAVFGKLNLLDNSRAVYRGWLGGIFITLMAVLVPYTGTFIFLL
jgi:H+/Cl- antiporter ClcA